MLLAPEQVDPVVGFLRSLKRPAPARRRSNPGARSCYNRGASVAIDYNAIGTCRPSDATFRRSIRVRQTRRRRGRRACSRGSTKRSSATRSRRPAHRRRAGRDQPGRDAESRRLELAERYWTAAETPVAASCERHFLRVSHPLTGDALEAAKAALILAMECRPPTSACSRARPNKRVLLGGNRLLVALRPSLPAVRRCASSPTATCRTRRCPPRTWHDAHAIYASPASAACTSADRAVTPRRRPRALRAGAAARAGQSVRLRAGPARDRAAITCRSTRTGRSSPTSRRCTGWRRRSRSSRSVTIFRRSPRTRAARSRAARSSSWPSISRSRSRSSARARGRRRVAGRRRSERIAAPLPDAAEAAAAAVGDSAGAAVQPAALARPGRDVRRDSPACGSTAAGRHAGVTAPPTRLPMLTHCEVINHTPAGYALRQTDPHPARCASAI